MHTKNKIQEINKQNLAFVFDFDGTITQKYVDGFEVPSIISILRSEGILNEEYPKESYALKDTYHPFELDQTLPLAVKYEKMEEWFRLHQELVIRHGLTKQNIKHAAHHPKLVLREGVKEVFTFAEENDIPIIIFSAAGIGTDSIHFFLERYGLFSYNIYTISNVLTYDENEKMTGFTFPFIHSLNKNESTLSYFPKIQKVLLGKKHIILFGDSPHDAEMVDDKNHEIVVRVGLCNEKDHEKKTKMLPLFQKKFDIVIEDDRGLDPIYEILK